MDVVEKRLQRLLRKFWEAKDDKHHQKQTFGQQREVVNKDTVSGNLCLYQNIPGKPKSKVHQSLKLFSKSWLDSFYFEFGYSLNLC